MFNRTHKSNSQVITGLGPLERRVLHLLWSMGDATVREILETGKVSGAYTTLMTTLDRLHKKGLLNREPEGRAFRYSPAQTRSEFNGNVVRSFVDQIFGSAGTASVSYLVEAISEHDRNLLDELQKAIEQKRRDLDHEGK